MIDRKKRLRITQITLLILGSIIIFYTYLNTDKQNKTKEIIISEETYMIVKSMYDFLKPVEINAKGFSRKIKYFEINMEESSKMHFSNISGLGYELVINEDLFEKKSLKELKIKLEKLKK